MSVPNATAFACTVVVPIAILISPLPSIVVVPVPTTSPDNVVVMFLTVCHLSAVLATPTNLCANILPPLSEPNVEGLSLILLPTSMFESAVVTPPILSVPTTFASSENSVS